MYFPPYRHLSQEFHMFTPQVCGGGSFKRSQSSSPSQALDTLSMRWAAEPWESYGKAMGKPQVYSFVCHQPKFKPALSSSCHVSDKKKVLM